MNEGISLSFKITIKISLEESWLMRKMSTIPIFFYRGPNIFASRPHYFCIEARIANIFPSSPNIFYRGFKYFFIFFIEA